jgi:hypothetical protein
MLSLNMSTGREQDQRTLLGNGTAFPLWRLHSGPLSSSVDQYSEKPPEHLPLTVAEALLRSAVTRNFLKNNLAGR